MKNFIFHNPTKVIFGAGEIAQIGEEIAKKGFKKVLLVTGSGSIKNNGVYQQTIKSLQESNVEWVEHWGVVPNPVLSHAREGVAIAKSESVDAILSVGGGSAIDESKAIAAGYYLNDVWDAYAKTAEINDSLPIFVVLTLSATGSEMNAFSVLTNAEEQKKWAMGAKSLYPVCTIIDPEVQNTLPWRQTVNGAVDAMSHLMEVYFAGDEYAETTIAISESLMNSIKVAIDRLIENEKDYIGRANLAWCATMALNGIPALGIGGGEWAVHRIEHGISALYPEVSHAEGLAVLFPAWIKYVSHLKPNHFKRWAKNVWNSDSIDEAIDMMKNTFKSWKAPVSMSDLKIGSESFDAIADNVMLLGEFGNMKVLNKEDVLQILRLAE